MMSRKCMERTVVFYVVLMMGCASKNNQPAMFDLLKADETGIDFTNKLTSTNQFNVFHYMYFYNGAGVAAGDFNNDGKIDLFFASNQGRDKIYLNAGNLHFKDVTAEAHIPDDSGWSTGVSVVDINNDGLLDIYVCRVGKYEVLNSHNEFLICKGIDKNGVPYYEDEAKKYGLDFSGFSTQAAFFDYDGDGDLDMYLLNHSIHQNGTFGARHVVINTRSDVSGDRFYRNDNGHFTDITMQSGINSSVLGYGLGISVADINMDGYPDIYIGNDFHEKDYLYLNNRDGSFTEADSASFMHTSQYTMGVDIADVNNDALPEIVSMDMLPSDPYILKRSEGEDDYDIFRMKIGYGYGYQYTRNNLQYNRGNGLFSDIGLYAGVAATDWSWGPLLVDFDNDGLKDLFITNGIPKRLNDIDYINYVSNDQLQMDIRLNSLSPKDISLIDKFPEIKIPNKFFRNNGAFSFNDRSSSVKNNESTFSNGAVAADFDGDGDLDIAVNNIDDAAIIYRNNTNGNGKKNYIDITLKGASQNRNAIGAKAIVFSKTDTKTYEHFPVHGFLSSAEIPMHIGLGDKEVDSVIVIWPDNSYQKLTWQNDTGKTAAVHYAPGLPKFNYAGLAQYHKNPAPLMEDITHNVNLNYRHVENEFPEFDREPLMPHMVSTEGPALSVADINHDGLDDVFIGACKRFKPVVFIQSKTGKFEKMNEPALDRDSVYEDVDACWADVNNDKNPDLIIASGGNEYYGQDSNLLPRIYLNDGKGNLTRTHDAFSNIYTTQSGIAVYDFNGDGYPDIFLGGRVVTSHYGDAPRSYLLLNDGTGKFTDVTNRFAKELSHVGMVTNAVWYDIDKDGDKDLVLSLEWDGIVAFINDHGHFTKKYLTDKKGWWNFVLPVDIDNDGDIDLIAGNLGLNSRLKASDKQPVRLYINDFDDNGTKEQILTYYLDNKEIPFANKEELQKQMPVIKKKYEYAGDFARASLTDLFSESKLKSSAMLTANWFSNTIFINDGKQNYKAVEMPANAQFTTCKTAAVADVNNDGLPDVLLGGNYYDNNIQMGRYDADYGTILLNRGNDTFIAGTLNGVVIKGQVRSIKPIQLANKQAFIYARNNDSALVVRFK
ncbi:VCBS repeat-containing protein [Parafilimonas sp.]|uniref:VCBS repeat-containing protein n=1 Tax=Parafilimonas sp. TaxID=1969739 RepID=UPI0039E385AE